MPITTTKLYEDGELVKVERKHYNDKRQRSSIRQFTPDEYITFLEKQLSLLEDEFKKNGRITYISY